MSPVIGIGYLVTGSKNERRSLPMAFPRVFSLPPIRYHTVESSDRIELHSGALVRPTVLAAAVRGAVACRPFGSAVAAAMAG